MKTTPRLHHYAQNITQGSLEDIIEMYKILNFEVVYRPNKEYKWAMVGQMQLRFAIQIVESEETPISDIELKKKTHIAFLSDKPQEVIDKVEAWAKRKNIQFRHGGWSAKELYFDLPDLFINFVVEVMHSSIEE
ncbi:MAG: hypothetical protein V4664_02795 [Patescibacteria group bacterium]